MTNFEKIAETPEALGEMLASLTVINSPWEDAFHKAFCTACGQTDCGKCPHENERNNPTWWLNQAPKEGDAPRGDTERQEEFRLRRMRNALLIWSFVASAISIVLSLIRLAR